MKSRLIVLFFGIVAVLMATAVTTYAQIDSRNQARPEREQNVNDPEKKKKRDRKNRDKRRRLKGRKEIRAAKRREAGSVDRKVYSNRKQIRENSRKTRRAKAKGADRGFYGDITGRKQSRPRNRNREVTRTYSQPDPYKNRRIRTERSRAGPDAPEVRSATRRGERARTGDISGQRTIRQKSRRSVQRAAAYPQPNPYVGRKVRTEKQRAKSNRQQIRSVRSITRPAESNPPRAGRRSGAVLSFAPTPRPKVKQKRNVYRNHERTGGERSTNRDIAGRQLRTRNTRSARQSSPVPYSSINPYGKTKRYGEGQRYRRTANRYSSARSISRSAESGANRSYDRRYGQHRNRSTVRISGFVGAKSVRSTADPRRRGDKRIYGNKYSPAPVRSASRGGESYSPRQPRGFVSVSGRRKTYRQRNTYQGKDRHFGENSTTRDIAGRKLRTRNKRSFHPSWAEFGGGTYGTGSVSGKPTKKYALAGGRRKSRANWNNRGFPVSGRNAPVPKGESSFTGRLPVTAMPSYGPGKEGTYRGRMPLGALRGYGSNQGSTYRGRIKANSLRMYKGGNESLFAGNRKARKRLQGGGSITAFWNNQGMPIAGRGPGPRGESRFTGRMPLSAMPSYGPGKEGQYTGRMPLSSLPGYGPGKESQFRGRMPLSSLRGYGPGKESQFRGRTPLSSLPGYGPGKESQFRGRMPLSSLRGYGPGKEGTFQGRQKGYRPLKGGGSITGFWNNNGRALRKRDRSPIDLASSGYRGSMPLSALPSFDDSREGSYRGTMKYRKPIKGAGGSITGRWNNNEQPIQGKGPGKYDVGRYTGSLPFYAIPAYGPDKIGLYQGNMKAKKPLKGGGGSITTQWNNNFQPIQGKGPGKYAVGKYTGNLPMSALPSYGDGKEGTYEGNMKRRDTKIKQSPGTERGRTRSLTFLRMGDPRHMGLNYVEKNLKVKNDLPKELSRTERQRIEDADGMNRGRTQSLSFLNLGNPTRGGLRVEMGNKKMKRDLPSEISGKNRMRIVDADGLDNGRAKSLTFWTIGDPTRGGLVKSPAQARGRLHPSSDYTKAGKQYNSLDKKEQPIKLKIWFARLFKRNANQPDAVKEKVRRPRYNKSEREIWETTVREDWYKN